MRMEFLTNGKFEQVAKKVILIAILLSVVVAIVGCSAD